MFEVFVHVANNHILCPNRRGMCFSMPMACFLEIVVMAHPVNVLLSFMLISK